MMRGQKEKVPVTIHIGNWSVAVFVVVCLVTVVLGLGGLKLGMHRIREPVGQISGLFYIRYRPDDGYGKPDIQLNMQIGLHKQRPNTYKLDTRQRKYAVFLQLSCRRNKYELVKSVQVYPTVRISVKISIRCISPWIDHHGCSCLDGEGRRGCRKYMMN